MTIQCQGQHHSEKLKHDLFPCCKWCKCYSPNGQPAPGLLKEWVGGLCPNEQRDEKLVRGAQC